MSSGATIPARAPASIDMLQIVIRPSIESARIADPRYSITWPTPPPVPIRLMMPRITSLAPQPAGQLAVDGDRHRLGGRLRDRLRGEHVLDLAGADAERERAERAVRRRVRVAADDRETRLRVAHLRADHVHDPLARRSPWVEGDVELLRVRREGIHLARARLVGHRAVGRRDVVVHRRDGEVGTADAAAGEPEGLEGLRAGHLMDEMEIDVEEIRLAVGPMHDVALPDLLRPTSSARAGVVGSAWPVAPGVSARAVPHSGTQFRIVEHDDSRTRRRPRAAAGPVPARRGRRRARARRALEPGEDLRRAPADQRRRRARPVRRHPPSGRGRRPVVHGHRRRRPGSPARPPIA